MRHAALIYAKHSSQRATSDVLVKFASASRSGLASLIAEGWTTQPHGRPVPSSTAPVTKRDLLDLSFDKNVYPCLITWFAFHARPFSQDLDEMGSLRKVEADKRWNIFPFQESFSPI